MLLPQQELLPKEQEKREMEDLHNSDNGKEEEKENGSRREGEKEVSTIPSFKCLNKNRSGLISGFRYTRPCEIKIGLL